LRELMNGHAANPRPGFSDQCRAELQTLDHR